MLIKRFFGRWVEVSLRFSPSDLRVGLYWYRGPIDCGFIQVAVNLPMLVLWIMSGKGDPSPCSELF